MTPQTTVTISKPPDSATLKAGTKQPVAPEYTRVATGVKVTIEALSANPIAAALGRATSSRFVLFAPRGTELKPRYRVVDAAGRKYEVTGEPLSGPLGVEVEMEGRS